MNHGLKLVILCTEDKAGNASVFQLKFDGEYANRKLIKNLTNDPDVCPSNREKCMMFRSKYDLDFTDSIIKVIKIKSVLPEFIDDSSEFVDLDFPEHDIMICAGVHPDILLDIPENAKSSGCKAIIVPVERPEWLDKSIALKLEEKCIEYGLEYAFPKPFCALKPGKFEYINKFISEFKIGCPEIKLYVDDENIVKDADVICSSSCGNTYNVASYLIGHKADDSLIEIANKYWHTYPCLASTMMDKDLKDSLLHKAGYINIACIKKALSGKKR